MPAVTPAVGNEGAHAIARDKGEDQKRQQGNLVECHWRSPQLEQARKAARL
jgi:hypothetical protein